MMHIVNMMMKFLRLIYFQLQKCHIQIQRKDDSIYSKLKPLHSTNIWTNTINNEVNDTYPIILVINTINIEHYNLRSNFVI
jgi:hypothetical protein